MLVALRLEIIRRRDPAKEPKFERIAGLQRAFPTANVFGHTELTVSTRFFHPRL